MSEAETVETVELVGGPDDGKVLRMPRQPDYVIPREPAQPFDTAGMRVDRYVETGRLKKSGHREAVFMGHQTRPV